MPKLAVAPSSSAGARLQRKADTTREIPTELLDPRIASGDVATERSHDAFDIVVEANLLTVESYASTPGLMRCLLHFDEEEAEFSRLYRKVSLDWNRRVARAIAKRCPDPLAEKLGAFKGFLQLRLADG